MKRIKAYFYEMDKKYSRTTSIIDAELAGCLPLLNDRGNFLNLKSTIEQHIALCYTLARARELVTEVEGEAEDLLIPFHEYVINELQYERRVAFARSVENLSEEFEQRILSTWSHGLIIKFGAEYTMNFMVLLNAFRAKRTR